MDKFICLVVITSWGLFLVADGLPGTKVNFYGLVINSYWVVYVCFRASHLLSSISSIWSVARIIKHGSNFIRVLNCIFSGIIFLLYLFLCLVHWYAGGA